MSRRGITAPAWRGARCPDPEPRSSRDARAPQRRSSRRRADETFRGRRGQRRRGPARTGSRRRVCTWSRWWFSTVISASSSSNPRRRASARSPRSEPEMLCVCWPSAACSPCSTLRRKMYASVKSRCTAIDEAVRSELLQRGQRVPGPERRFVAAVDQLEHLRLIARFRECHRGLLSHPRSRLPCLACSRSARALYRVSSSMAAWSKYFR